MAESAKCTYKEKVHGAAAERGHKAKVVNDENLETANVHLKHEQDETKDSAKGRQPGGMNQNKSVKKISLDQHTKWVRELHARCSECKIVLRVCEGESGGGEVRLRTRHRTPR